MNKVDAGGNNSLYIIETEKEGILLHSKQTVKYICEKYPSGNCYYYKQEIITHDSWDELQSLAWSAPRPVSEATYRKQKEAGYKTFERYIEKKPAKILHFYNK